MGRLRKDKNKENILFENCNYYLPNPKEYKSSWKQGVFMNKNDIHIEIGCGKGLFIINKALENPNINYIAIDKFATILYKLLKKVEIAKLKNIKLVYLCASNIDEIFGENEVSKIYLNFSDPWPKKRHEKNRLTNNIFLSKYFIVLNKFGSIEFKTDSDALFEYTLTTLSDNNYKILFKTDDLYKLNDCLVNETQTEYEIKWKNIGKKIKKIIFCYK